MEGQEALTEDQDATLPNISLVRSSVLLYASKTWTLLSADLRTLEAFHMRC